MATDHRTSRFARRRVPAAFLALGCLLFAACSAAPAASAPSPSASAAAPGATSPSPSLSLATPGPSKPLGPDAADTYTGVLSFDSIEGGCAYLQTAVGRQAPGPLPRRLDPGEVARSSSSRPTARSTARAGDTVTDQGQRGDGHGLDLPDRTDHPRHRGPRPLDRRTWPRPPRVARYLARLARDDRTAHPDRTLRPDRDRAALAGALGRARAGRDRPRATSPGPSTTC